MKYHKYDADTGIYIETIESGIDGSIPNYSVAGNLPEETEYYTIAYINNEWVSVVRPEYIISENGFEKINKE